MSAHIHWATSPAPTATTFELRLSMRPRFKSIIQRTFAQWQPSFLDRDRRTIYSKVKALEAGTGQVRSTVHQRNRPGCPLPSTSSSMATSVRSDTSMAIVFPNFPDVQNQIHTQKGLDRLSVTMRENSTFHRSFWVTNHFAKVNKQNKTEEFLTEINASERSLSWHDKTFYE